MKQTIQGKDQCSRVELQFFCRSVFGIFNAYQLLTSEGPHVWKVWTDDDDDDLS